MDFNRDEVRRQLVESTRDHAESMPRFREALKQLFDPDRPAPAEVKAGLLGVPSRRAFLTIGGVSVLGSAILVGCGHQPTNQIAQTGTTPPQPSSTTTTAPGSPANDLTLLRTAQSIEVLAVNAYATALSSPLVTTPGIRSAFTLFRSQHQDHGNLLATATTDAGGTPYTKANIWLDVEVVQPAIKAAKTEADIVTLATELEDTAAQTYVLAGGVLTTQNLRAALMSIGATEARHLTTLYLVQQQQPVPLSIFPTSKAAPATSYIGPNGPVVKNPPPPTTAASA